MGKKEKKYPYKKGGRDRDIGNMALLKGMPSGELLEQMSSALKYKTKT